MSQKILIAFDDSENAMRAVEYVAETFNKDCRIKLFCVVADTATLCDMNSPGLTPYFKSQQHAFCTLEDQKKSLIEEAFVKARQCLIEAGFSKDNISSSIEKKHKGIAMDIVNASIEYDLVVIGRRGISGIKEYFLGSISQKVLHLATNVSILIVN